MNRIFRISISVCFSLAILIPVSAEAISPNPTPDCSAGTTCTITFNYSGDYYTWIVPTNSSMTYEVQGAQGGTTTELFSPAAGGLGGKIAGTLTLSSGTTLYIYPGQQPDAGSSSGGWNGGGNPGTATAGLNGQGGRSGGGGGASDIRTGTTLASRIIVAGGGGGSARDYVNGSCRPCGTGGAGGVGGSATGGTGVSATNGYTPGIGGSGGTQSAGGLAGTSFNPGTAGALGTGGNGSSGGEDVASGGGGGGYYGGGGGSQPPGGNGGGGGGGGGGSSYFNPSFASASLNSQGVRSGNGFISITYSNSPVVVTISSSGNLKTVKKGETLILTATSDTAGKVTFYAAGKKIPGCVSLPISIGTRTCTWKASIQRITAIKAYVLPSSGGIASFSQEINVAVVKRTGLRS